MEFAQLTNAPDDQLAALTVAWMQHRVFCEKTLEIRDKSGTSVPIRLSPAQVMLSDEFARQEAQGKPVRIILLKARQIHASAGCATEFFKRIPFVPGRTGAVVAHKEFSAKLIYGYYQQYLQAYAKHPLEVGNIRVDLPKQLLNSMDEMSWDNGSSIRLMTAGSKESGRSFAAQFLHLSEVAFYQDAIRFFLGLMQTVPDLPGTAIVIESTANGVGTAFHTRWLEAVAGNSAYVPLFFPWFKHPEYHADPGRPDQFQESLSHEEQDLQRTHGLTLRQLAWRRITIIDKCDGSVDNFRQEYPSTAEEAFLTSGRTRFDIGALGLQSSMDAEAGELTTKDVGPLKVRSFMVRRDGRGLLRVYQRPVRGRAYVIGADPAQGIDVGEQTGTQDPDWSVSCVLDVETVEQVAVLRGRLTPGLFAAYTTQIGYWYNTAYLVPEAVGVGIALVEQILALNYPIQALHVRRRNPDDRRTPMLQEVGFKTSSVTKPQLIEGLNLVLVQGAVTLHDAITLAELRTYVTRADGSTQGSVGCHDDCVMALALAIYGVAFAPRRPIGMSQQDRLIRPGRYHVTQQSQREDDD